MKNYKADYYNPETFEKTEIETKVSIDLVDKVKQSLDSMDGYLITPTMINEKDLSVAFGVMDMNDKTMKYNVIITPIH